MSDMSSLNFVYEYLLHGWWYFWTFEIFDVLYITKRYSKLMKTRNASWFIISKMSVQYWNTSTKRHGTIIKLNLSLPSLEGFPRTRSRRHLCESVHPWLNRVWSPIRYICIFSKLSVKIVTGMKYCQTTTKKHDQMTTSENTTNRLANG